ncbi:uncharacterized protein I303_106452 [Kwoniella dejecticola CBS 10117]|uniref:Monopolin complex subunit Csm1/Pcs1 C-terminal domain-containing protein n=1 Tax=Kwoniella dejecticola CBS 10117 TaxID=1296121 RepID=A0A1A5ZUN8_9TREE|nr:uncharacterized protein I303_08289 [Kwoniella dejecticola CBS 10117]OBR81519.1 hypothetical protein I303_08289 [Kwoniella dejecticola CBS 10117]
MASATTSKGVKKVGKENAPPSRSTKRTEDGDGNRSEGSDADDLPSKASKAPSSKSTNVDEDDPKELKRRLKSALADRERYRTQRDTYSTQFEELTKSHSDGSDLLEKYKQKAELQAKAQNDVIAAQTALTEKLQAKVKSLEKALSLNEKDKELPSAGGPFDDPSTKADPKDIKALKDELTKLKNESKAKDTEISELQKQYNAEVEYSKSLIAGKQSLNSSTNKSLGASTNSAPSYSTNPEEAAKDAASLALYEDLTLIQIANVKIKPARIGNEEVFNCILSADGRSLNFKLRCYREVDRSETPPTYTKQVHYTPELLQHESEAFIKRLDYFANEFVVPRDQLSGFMLEMRAKMSDECE